MMRQTHPVSERIAALYHAAFGIFGLLGVIYHAMSAVNHWLDRDRE